MRNDVNNFGSSVAMQELELAIKCALYYGLFRSLGNQYKVGNLTWCSLILKPVQTSLSFDHPDGYTDIGHDIKLPFHGQCVEVNVALKFGTDLLWFDVTFATCNSGVELKFVGGIW